MTADLSKSGGNLRLEIERIDPFPKFDKKRKTVDNRSVDSL